MREKKAYQNNLRVGGGGCYIVNNTNETRMERKEPENINVSQQTSITFYVSKSRHYISNVTREG